MKGAVRRKFRLLIGGVAMVALSVAGAGSARADYSWGHNGNGYINHGDPVNLVFAINASWTRTYDHVLAYTGWYDRGGSPASFPDHSDQAWDPMDGQAASAPEWDSRYHIRYDQGNDWGGAAWGTWTMGAAHYDQLTWCDNWYGLQPGHVSSTFDGGRNVVLNAFAGQGYATGWVDRGLVAIRRQCDGSYVGGDGWYVWIDLP